MRTPAVKTQGAVGALFLALALGAQAQVYKCVVNGKTVYQESPCAAGRSTVINTPRGPSEQDVKDAQARADADRAHAAEADKAAQRTPPKSDAPKPAAAGSNCSYFNARYAELVRKRDNAVRLERRFPSPGLAAGPDYIKQDFDRLEEQMRQANCPIPGG